MEVLEQKRKAEVYHHQSGVGERHLEVAGHLLVVGHPLVEVHLVAGHLALLVLVGHLQVVVRRQEVQGEDVVVAMENVDLLLRRIVVVVVQTDNQAMGIEKVGVQSDNAMAGREVVQNENEMAGREIGVLRMIVVVQRTGSLQERSQDG